VVVRGPFPARAEFLHAAARSRGTQLATYLGWRLHGARGGIAAGVLFVLPSVFILLGLSRFYMAGGNITWVQGIVYGLIPAVIAIVFSAVKRIGSKALK
jgi:chromate transporter